eukprot:6212921-Pleurochrysis_carterae.AAC.4
MRSGLSSRALSGGVRSSRVGSSASTPSPVFAEMASVSDGSMSKADDICSSVPATSAWPRSTLFTTGMIERSCSNARKKLATVCACTPLVASTRSSAPWHAAIDRDTSYEKSTWPGVSIRLNKYGGESGCG